MATTVDQFMHPGQKLTYDDKQKVAVSVYIDLSSPP
jgi:hypothetical protein